MNTGLPVYIPNTCVCYMMQYTCCNNVNCRLYLMCSQIKPQSVCKRDCPSCDYKGCSLSQKHRKDFPVYVTKVIQSERVPLDLEGSRSREQAVHRMQHKKLYEYYNDLLGDRRERRNQQSRARYWRDPDYYRQLARESYRRRYIPHPKKLDQRFQPECQFRCDACPYPDCILPADWKRRAYAEDFIKRNPDYFRQYRQEHSEELKAYNHQYYATHKEECREYQKEHRQKPEIKAQRAAYDKAYRQTPAGKESAKRRKAKYYAAHREEINEKRREKRRNQKEQHSNPQ